MLPEDFPARVMKRTEALYRIDKLNCAESVFKAVLEEAGHECPLELVRLATPFGRGMGGAGCTCGALAGGQMALGFFLGRTEMKDFKPKKCFEAAKMLHDAFKEHNKATCCRILRKGLEYGTKEQREACVIHASEGGRIAAEVLKKCLDKNI